MTRGKNAAKAANRQQVILDREGPLLRRIERLEAQLAEADRKNLRQQAEHLAESKRLRMMIAANTNDRLDEALSELTEARRLFEVSETARRVLNSSIMRLGDALQDSLEKQGMKVLDAREVVLKVTRYYATFIDDSSPGFIRVSDINVTAGTRGSANGLAEPDADPEEILKMHRLQRARGMRS